MTEQVQQPKAIVGLFAVSFVLVCRIPASNIGPFASAVLSGPMGRCPNRQIALISLEMIEKFIVYSHSYLEQIRLLQMERFAKRSFLNNFHIRRKFEKMGCYNFPTSRY